MPDLDELLVEDAHRSRVADGTPSEFGPALERALGVAHRRRATTVAVSAVAVVATGSLFALNANSHEQPATQVRLAAYDRVLGPVPNEDGSVYVVGPKDEHTAGCEVVPGMSVTREPSSGDPTGIPHAFAIRMPPGTQTGLPSIGIIRGMFGTDPLYVFICPTD